MWHHNGTRWGGRKPLAFCCTRLHPTLEHCCARAPAVQFWCSFGTVPAPGCHTAAYSAVPPLFRHQYGARIAVQQSCWIVSAHGGGKKPSVPMPTPPCLVAGRSLAQPALHRYCAGTVAGRPDHSPFHSPCLVPSLCNVCAILFFRSTTATVSPTWPALSLVISRRFLLHIDWGAIWRRTTAIRHQMAAVWRHLAPCGCRMAPSGAIWRRMAAVS